MFDLFDYDGTKTITFDELERATLELGDTPDPEEIQVLFLYVNTIIKSIPPCRRHAVVTCAFGGSLSLSF